MASFCDQNVSGKSKIDGGDAGMAHESSIIFITGGVRSGKSSFAEKMAMECGSNPLLKVNFTILQRCNRPIPK